MAEGLEPPVYYDVMFDGEEHLRIGDLQRAVVDFAVACEAYLRISVRQRLPVGLSDEVQKYVDDANIRQVLGRFFPEALDVEQAKLLGKISSALHKLFDVRNTILHSGRMEALTPKDCQTFLDATQQLISMEVLAVEQKTDSGHVA